MILDYQDELTVTSLIKKRKLVINLTFALNQPARATFIENGVSLSVNGDVCSPAQTQPLTEQAICECFNKSELFEVKVNLEKLDSVFLTKKQLNDFRRNVLDQVFQALTNAFRKNAIRPLLQPLDNNTLAFADFEFATDDTAKYSAQNVIFSPEIYELDSLLRFMQNCKNQGKTPYLDTPNFATKNDIKLLEQIIKESGVNTIANNYYALTLPNAIVGGGLNVYNSWTANFLALPFITAENGLHTPHPFPYMTLRHCPIKSHVGGNCKNCNYSNEYCFYTESGKALKLKRKKLCSCTFYLTDLN